MEKEIFDKFGQALVWMDQNEDKWDRNDDGYFVLLTENVPVFIKEVIALRNKAIDREMQTSKTLNKLEGRE